MVQATAGSGYARKPAFVIVPGVVGNRLGVEPRNDGFVKLRKRGLCVEIPAIELSSNLVPIIVGQDPRAGARVRRGTTVTLEISVLEGRAPRALPDFRTTPSLVGSTLRTAFRRLARARIPLWEVVEPASLPASRAPTLDAAFFVTYQSPSAGAVFRQVEEQIDASGSIRVFRAPVDMGVEPRLATTCGL